MPITPATASSPGRPIVEGSPSAGGSGPLEERREAAAAAYQDVEDEEETVEEVPAEDAPEEHIDVREENEGGVGRPRLGRLMAMTLVA